MIVTDFRVYLETTHSYAGMSEEVIMKEISIDIQAGGGEKITQHNLHKAIAEYMEENFEKDTYAVSKKLE